MKAALAQTTVDQQTHIFLEFPAIFISMCDKKMCLLTSFSVSFLNIYQKDLGNFNNKNKTLHLQNNDVTTKFQQLWRHVSKPSLTPRIFPNTCMLSIVILQKAHIFCLGGALRNIFSLRIHALIISIPLCYFRGLVKKNKRRKQTVSFFLSWFVFRYASMFCL